MKEVEGTTLERLIADVHRSRVQPDGRPWTLARLVDAFHRACQAVAFAHARNVVHRDLKPANIMVGAFGEVLVMDWGLSKVLVDGTPTLDDGEDSVVTDRSRVGTLTTRHGAIVGTPAYMAPEQAAGGAVQFASDVYALGCILFEILTGRRAFPQGSLESLLDAKLGGSVPAPTRGMPAGTVPEELAAICERATAVDAVDRYQTAGELAQEVGEWVDGEKRRERARSVVQEALALRPELDELLEESRVLAAEAEGLLESLPPTSPVGMKREAWAHQDRAAALTQEAAVKAELYVQTLRTALNHDPELREAHELLADHYRAQHRVAEEGGDILGASRLETALRFHDRGAHAAYLRGDGTMTLLTQPAGASVDLYQFVERDRRLVPRFERHLGRTPLRHVELPRGSHLLRIRSPGHHTALYPVQIGREQHWDGKRPGGRRIVPVTLLPEDALADDEVYVPGGWTRIGGDPEAIASLSRRRVWVDGFVIRRFPVTNREYLAFLNALVAAGRDSTRSWPRAVTTRRSRPRPGNAAAAWGRAVLSSTRETSPVCSICVRTRMVTCGRRTGPW
jgi:serine/threonine-protein kinase